MKAGLATKVEPNKNGAPIVARDESMFDSLQREMNKLFDEVRHGVDFFRPKFGELKEMPVKVDVKNHDKEIVIMAEIPGVDMNEVDIAVTPHYLSISGEKKAEHAAHDQGYYRMERNYGFFRRVIALPFEVETEKTEAVYKDGVVRINLPKTGAAMSAERKVPVKAG